jgi:hypothetical protein
MNTFLASYPAILDAVIEVMALCSSLGTVSPIGAGWKIKSIGSSIKRNRRCQY